MSASTSFDDLFVFKFEHVYDHKTIEAVRTRRRSLGNELFFDRLLQESSTSHTSASYPPKSMKELRALYDHTTSQTDKDRSNLLTYYLLLDVRTNPGAADDFVQQQYLSEGETSLIRGLWCLDHHQTQDAVGWLTQPVVTVSHSEKILRTLIHDSPNNDYTLPLAFYYATSPTLREVTDLEKFVFVLFSVTVSEAVAFARKHPENIHKVLFERIVHLTLTSTKGEDRGNKAVELVEQPFTAAEDEWLEEYLSSEQGRQLHGAKDTLIMRRIATGNHSDSASEYAGRNIDGLNWGMLTDAFTRSHGPRQAISRLS